MAQSMGVQEVQRSGRARVPFGLITAVLVTATAALLLAPAIRAGNAPAVRPDPNPVARLAPATTGPATADYPTTYGRALAAAKISGRLAGAKAPATSSTPNPGGVNFADRLKAGRA